jgi:hypothetical protein
MTSRFLLIPFLCLALTACKGEGGGGGDASNPPTTGGSQPPPVVTPPALNVTSISPSTTTNVPVNQTFTVTFSEAIDPVSIIANSGAGIDTISISSTNGQETALTLVNTSISGNTLTIQPQYDLLNRTAYTLKISSAVMGKSGAIMNQDKVFTFTSGVAAGDNPGDQVTVTWEEEGFTDSTTGEFITKFLLDFGRVSKTSSEFKSYEIADFKMDETPKLNGAYSGMQSFKAVVKYNFLPNATYYFQMKACTENICSYPTGEVSADF